MCQSILVIDDVEESRDCIETLLRSDGYVVGTARSEADAIVNAIRIAPSLVLINFGSPTNEAVATAKRIRQRGVLDTTVPIVLFCIEAVAEGDNVDFGDNIYVAHPDNFNQLRGFIRRLLLPGL